MVKKLTTSLLLLFFSVSLYSQDNDTITTTKINKTGDKIRLSFGIGKDRLEVDGIEVFIVFDDSINCNKIIKTYIENASFKLPELKDYLPKYNKCFFAIRYGFEVWGADIPISFLLNNDSIYLWYNPERVSKNYYPLYSVTYEGLFFVQGNRDKKARVEYVSTPRKFSNDNAKRIVDPNAEVIDHNSKEVVQNKKLYKAAFDEMLEMLQGKKAKSLKRIVFLYENTFSKDTLNYDRFCKTIDSIVYRIDFNIKYNNLEQYKTAGNYMTFSYLKEASPMNKNNPYEYDFNDYWGREGDGTKGFVTRLLRTRKGNCTSFPLLYKILCDELGAESYLSILPIHMYIRHPDDNGGWTNIELTSGGFPTDQWIIQQFGISVEAIKSGIYMKALSDTENVVFGITRLVGYYQKKYGYDDFTLQMIDTALAYCPDFLQAIMAKMDYLLSQAEQENQKEIPNETLIKEFYDQRHKYERKMVYLGYTNLPEENFNEMMNDVDKEIERQKGLGVEIHK
ncbi:MAG: hypothetical protein LBO06_03395 [Bacteroidales bacterium]|jgi:hypothetical protein|nr:hypothetical protein [Bacteroidales bacterium]